MNATNSHILVLRNCYVNVQEESSHHGDSLLECVGVTSISETRNLYFKAHVIAKNSVIKG